MGKYDDIIDHPHYQSKKRPHMSMINRAAQFSPFAALAGYDAAVAETGRLTEERAILDESAIEEINRVLQEIESRISEKPYTMITYFEDDALKDGGHYVYFTGNVTKIDRFEKKIIMTDGTRIPMADIFEVSIL